jgi:hypothetical protein
MCKPDLKLETGVLLILPNINIVFLDLCVRTVAQEALDHCGHL